MAVAVDAVANSGFQTAASYSYTHTVSGAERLLVVEVSIDANAQSVSAITYNTVALTFKGRVLTGGAAGASEIWSLTNPATGANSVAVTLSAATGSVTGSVSFTGVDQSTPLGAFFSALGDSTSPSVTVTDGSTTGFTIDIVTVSLAASETYTVDASQTERWNVFSDGLIRGVGSTEPGAASVVMSGTISAILKWAIAAVAVLPAAVGQPAMRRVQWY